MSRDVQYLTDEKGVRTAVILPLSDYEDLMEDLMDFAAIADRRNEPTIAHDEFVIELKRDGLIPN